MLFPRTVSYNRLLGDRVRAAHLQQAKTAHLRPPPTPKSEAYLQAAAKGWDILPGNEMCACEDCDIDYITLHLIEGANDNTQEDK